jgi:hypothetical protein
LETTCQRCHETLRDADRYCPTCGLPQLIYIAAETPAIPLDEGTAQPAAMGNDLGGLTGGIAWRPALKASLMLAIPAGLMCSGLTPIGQSLALGVVWIMGAAAWAVGLYGKRARPARLSMGAGARIGLVTGLLTSWFTLSVDGISLWVARFMLHEGSQMDSLWASEVEKGFARNQQMVNQMGMTGAQATQFLQMTQFFRGTMLSPEGRAGFALAGLIIVAAFLLLFAIIGGAVGARLLAQPRRSGA